VRLSTRFRRTLRKSHWVVRADTEFDRVIDACADTPREGQDGTWITTGMKDAYCTLHRLGFAHSIEVWDGDRLVGGLYGVAIGRMFFAESMVSLATGGSKVALAALAHHLHAWGWPVIDAQLENPHLLRMGGQRWPRERFLAVLRAEVGQAGVPGPWTDRVGAWPAAALAGPPG
jgi:leucyl/phenylalanyl-tRNA--protein transferase